MRVKVITSSTSIVWRWWILAIGVATADQSAKLAVSTLMPYGQSIPLTSFFNLVHVWNTGAAFSFLSNAGGWQRYFFIVLSLGVSIVLAIMLRKPRGRTEALGYSLILGGALSNGFDRIVRGHVVDFLDFFWQSWHWPAFNLADTSITLGAVALLWTTCFSVEAPHSTAS